MRVVLSVLMILLAGVGAVVVAAVLYGVVLWRRGDLTFKATVTRIRRVSGSHDELPYDPDPASQWDGLVQRAQDSDGPGGKEGP